VRFTDLCSTQPVAYALIPQPGYTYMLPPQPFAAMAAPPAAASSTHSKKGESHYRHYVHERVREKSIRAASEPPTIEKAAPPPPVPQPNTPTMTYGAFPFSMPTTAIPVAYAMPNYPLPVHASTASNTSSAAAAPKAVYKPNEMVPKAASPDQLFWCIEPDDSNTLREFRTIEEDLQPGKWKVDPRYGNAYFVRDKLEKKDKEKK
jgi:hypothetical protein